MTGTCVNTSMIFDRSSHKCTSSLLTVSFREFAEIKFSSNFKVNTACTYKVVSVTFVAISGDLIASQRIDFVDSFSGNQVGKTIGVKI